MKKRKGSRLPAWLAFGSIFLLVLFTSLACDVTKPNAGYPIAAAGPFTAKDCEIPGLPAPVADKTRIYDTNIYCVFHSGGSFNGVLHFHLYFFKNSDDAVKQYGSYHDEIVDYFSSYNAYTDTLEELSVMHTTVDMNGGEPFNDVAATQIYSKHFVIYIEGAIDNASQSAAQAMVINLMGYGTKIADEHYPGYH